MVDISEFEFQWPENSLPDFIFMVGRDSLGRYVVQEKDASVSFGLGRSPQEALDNFWGDQLH